MNKKYLILQLKRALKIYPGIILVTLLSVASIICTALILLETNTSERDTQIISVGVVGDMQDSYLDIGLSVLKMSDDSSFYLNLIEMNESTAKSKLKNREISGYIHVPENYVKDILRGKNTPAKYIMLNAPEGFGTIVSEEIAQIVSEIVTESQLGMYSMQNLAKVHNIKPGKFNNPLALTYVDFILNRNNMYDVETLGIADSLSFVGYYICGFVLLFIMLWGISCNGFFVTKNHDHSRILYISGILPRSQILCEYLAYLIITLITLFSFSAIFGAFAQNIALNVPELIGVRVIDCLGFIIKILPVIVMLTLMQMTIYEISKGIVTGLLIQFILTIVLGYVSGCFYPAYFFPVIVQKISSFLPVGAGFSFIRKTMAGIPSFIDFVLVFGYIAIFYAMLISARKHKITGDVK